ENVHVSSDLNLVDFRFPVQYVIRPDLNFRGYAGKIVSGTIAVGEEVAILPSGKRSKIKEIVTFDGNLEEASAPFSVILTLKDEIDISRGDMIVREHNIPQINRNFDAIICWMWDEPLQIGKNYLIKHSTKTTKAFVSKLDYMIDVNTLHRKEAKTLELNEIGRVEINATQPIMFDSYNKNRGTGSFILIDPDTNFTVAVGMIREPLRSLEETLEPELSVAGVVDRATNVTREEIAVPLNKREEKNSHKAVVIWLTGLSGSGKSTIAKNLDNALFDLGCHTAILDGDNVRHGLCKDLGFSDKDRNENIRRVGEVAKILFDHGSIVICTFISPARKQRGIVRSLMPEGRFFEVFVRCSLKACIGRDPKGLYKKAIDGKIPEFTGISAPYEEPLDPEIIIDTEHKAEEENIKEIIERLRKNEII
ncbi:MAG: adenylyl-sulfate kinase, partial [Candidatus Anammoxibacter sp.]